jgi:hypothetical protein
MIASTWNVDPVKILARCEVANVLEALVRQAPLSRSVRITRVILRLACCCGLRVSDLTPAQVDCPAKFGCNRRTIVSVWTAVFAGRVSICEAKPSACWSCNQHTTIRSTNRLSSGMDFVQRSARPRFIWRFPLPMVKKTVRQTCDAQPRVCG